MHVTLSPNAFARKNKRGGALRVCFSHRTAAHMHVTLSANAFAR